MAIVNFVPLPLIKQVAEIISMHEYDQKFTLATLSYDLVKKYSFVS